MKDTYATVIVDLTPSEDEIMANIHKDARWGIKKAQREGLRAEEAGLSEKEYAMYAKTMTEGGSEPQTMYEFTKEMIVLFVCLKDDEIIASASLKMQDGRCTLHTNSSLKEYQHLQPNNLLYWQCIRWAKAHGYKELDLGGWQINAPKDDHTAGINRFKEKWGKIVYFEKDYPVLQALGRKAIKKSNLLWKLNKKLKGRK